MTIKKCDACKNVMPQDPKYILHFVATVNGKVYDDLAEHDICQQCFDKINKLWV